MNRKLLQAGPAGAMLLLALALTSCNMPQEQAQYRPRPATRIVLLTPVPTSPLVMTVPGRVTVAPQPTPGSSAQAPTPPSATGIATASVEIGGITPVPLLENTPAPGAVLTVVLPAGTASGLQPFLTATAVAGSGVTPPAGGATGDGADQVAATAAGTGAPAAAGAATGTGTPAGTPESGNGQAAASEPAPGGAGSPQATAALSPAAAPPLPTDTATQLTSPSAVAGGHGSPRTADEQQRLDLGQQVYVANCATCHGNGGEGNAQFPPLERNTAVTGDPQLVIQTILSGKGIMPSWRGKLSDEEIAAVVSYIRSAWSNDAPPVTADMVTNRNR